MTRHAQQRRKEMKVSEQRVQDVLDHPLMDVPSTQHATRRMAFGTDIVIIYEPSNREIVTVLWRSDVEYRRRCA